ncbi:2-amino-3-carboxymuconate-6-semialdehyde decarboxylase protein [Rutstroemia sp. NJR-2017a BVV2]|nr:2-amino-3-carboxymuconate-6-semialdehyde decarboxylase protein [Rutstroemia sp. NJR-2017a BVV2]
MTSVLSISAPGSTVFAGNGAASAALARLLNEWHAALVRKYPTRFSFVAVIPLPYTQEAITEATYALRKLDAAGIGLLSNHEGYYLGNSNFRPFFKALNDMSKGNITVFIHPNSPYLHVNGTLIDANPSKPCIHLNVTHRADVITALYGSGLVELYFDTARTLMDLIVTGTVQNYSSIMYQVPHTGDSFPSIIDRFLSTSSADTAAVYKILQTRFWWDSAGPTYPHQVQGLLAYDISKSQLIFGTDYPYGYNYNATLQSILRTSFLEPSDIAGILSSNAREIYQIRN